MGILLKVFAPDGFADNADGIAGFKVGKVLADERRPAEKLEETRGDEASVVAFRKPMSTEVDGATVVTVGVVDGGEPAQVVEALVGEREKRIGIGGIMEIDLAKLVGVGERGGFEEEAIEEGEGGDGHAEADGEGEDGEEGEAGFLVEDAEGEAEIAEKGIHGRRVRRSVFGRRGWIRP